MKKRMERIGALLLSAVVLFSGVVSSSDESGLMEETPEKIVAAEEADHSRPKDGEQVAAGKQTGDQQSTEKEQQELLQEEQLLGDPDKDIDYKQIIKEISEESYRESVEISNGAFVVVRNENSTSKSIEEESWYQETGAISNEIIEVSHNGTEEQTVAYRIETDKKDIWEVVDYMNEEGNVEIAEPEYVYHLCDSGLPSEQDNEGMTKQWYLNDQSLTDVWADDDTYGDATGQGVVVAVIDTGVDYTHEDLQNNMWMNTAELGGAEGVDDDGNGYVDDIYGINLIDTNVSPADDHGHGTHVAGIIAMENNQTGGVGIAYHAQIMSIKAAGSDGTLNSSDISKAITYAYRNGADVINMSFGSYAHSAIVEAALQDAFTSSVLVAAAGNDGIPTLDHPVAAFKGNMYPASYSYVIGVMAYDSNGQITDFSNWDYKPNYGAEYEIAAPGKSIYSTLPGNRYASWDGTSMATPMVSAVAAILRSSKPDKNAYPSRYLMGQIVSATEESISFISPYSDSEVYSRLCLRDALTKKPKPNINVDEVYVFDSTDISESTNNGDGIIQPGEVIDLAVGLRNQWGAAKEVYLTVNATSAGGVENPYVEFLTGQEVLVDDIGTFGTQNNGFVYDENNVVVGVSNPIRVKISENAPNDLNIQFNINFHARNALDETDDAVYSQLLDTAYTLSVVKGTVLEGKITSDMTLKADEYYIVKNSLLVPKGVTVDVEPGTQIQFWGADQSSVYGDDYIAYISVQGNMNFNGTEDAPIELFPGKDFENYRVQIEEANNGTINMNYANVINPYLSISEGNHLNCVQDYDEIVYREINDMGVVDSYSGYARINCDSMSNSKISNLRGINEWTKAEVSGSFDTVLFDNCQISYNGIQAVNCTFLDNQGRVEDPYSGTLQYFASKMSDVGNKYMTPQYETISDVIELNGKKYVAYKFENYFFNGYWDDNVYYSKGFDNFKALENVLQRNGGHIAALNQDDQEVKDMVSKVYEDYMGEDKSSSNYMYFMNGYYYDQTEGKIVSTDGTEVPDVFGAMSQSAPLTSFGAYWGQLSDYNEETGEWESRDGVCTFYSYGGSEMKNYVIAEYPEDVADYTVKNPAFDLESLNIMESTKFTHNAILNRLISKNTSDWMKVAGTSGNIYTYMVSGNYWGTSSPDLVQKQLIDFDTNIRYSDIITDPILETPHEDTYPCVSDMYLEDKNGDRVSAIGNGTYTVHVIFNRDMDQTVDPTVTYGPDDPYTDYTVSGSWVSAREWVGTTTVKILVNQGQQYFRVKNAAAASDSWLTTGTDWGRFGFNIEATGAEALTLQGEGIKGGIYLNWTQDEYDTMAGYNVYRSETGEKNTFKKANSSIISVDEKEFTDKKVTSGKKYYYYFTVVDTAMVESRPSNIISCASLDDELPVIKHSAAKSLTNGINATITATITDNVGVNSVALYYRMQGETEYKRVMMINTSGHTYSAQISSKDITPGILEYYMEAADSVAYAYSGTSAEPYAVVVESNAVITSVKAENGVVGQEVEGTINGINLAENYEVRVEGNIVDSTFVSDTEITFQCVPEYMGKKKVELMQNGAVVASFSNAFTVSDSSIKVYNNETTVVKEKSSWQYVYLYSNYVGKLENLEVSYAEENNCPYISTVYGWSNCSDSSQDGICTRTFKMGSGCMATGDRLLSIEMYNKSDEVLPEIVSVKINGVEVSNLDYQQDRVTFIDQSAYVTVDEVVAEEPNVVLDVGESFVPEVTVSPSNATMRDNLTYQYDSNYLQRNEDGSFTALRSGGTYLSVYCEDVRAEIYVYTNPVPVTRITAEKTSYTGTEGSTITINVTAEPLESDVCLSWANYDTSKAEVLNITNNGRTAIVSLKQQGETMVGVMCDVSGQNISCNIPIEIVENTSYVEIDEEIMTLYPNQVGVPTAHIRNLSSDGTEKLTWTSSNTSVVTVDEDGRVMANASGCAILTASIDGSKRMDSVIVLVGSDSMSYTTGDINFDGAITSTDAMLALKLSMEENTIDAIQKVADVNADGKVTAADAMLILQYVTGVISEF